MVPSQSIHLLPPSPHFPPRRPFSVSGFSSLPSSANFKLSTLNFLRGLCSGGSSDPCHSPIPRLSNSSLSWTPMAVGCEPATVSRFTPSINVDAVDAASSLTPLFAALTENTGGWGYKFSTQEFHCHPRRLSIPPYFITSLPRFLFGFTHQHPQLQSFHALTSQFSVYRTFFNFPPTAHFHCGNKLPRQPSYNPAGMCAREVPKWPEL
jgi:hypothetical protein